MNTFSIVTPARNAEKKIPRSICSVLNQSYPEWEHIIVDDASEDKTVEVINKFIEKDSRIKLIEQAVRKERVQARIDGMQFAENDWICWLDADDEWMSNYLEIFNDAINDFPEYKVFYCGSLEHRHNNNGVYDTRMIPLVDYPETEKGLGDFKSGTITSGGFVFHRSILNEVEPMKPSLRAYGLPDNFASLNRHPLYPMREDGHYLPMGNPFGDDFYWFWKITRDNKAKKIPMILNIKHIRS